MRKDTVKHRIPDVQDKRLFNALKDIEQGHDPSARLEIQLMLEGLLVRLEQARILPVVDNPNPYDPTHDEARHEQWWVEHPQEAERFEQGIDLRNVVLRHIYVGTLIGSGPWNIP